MNFESISKKVCSFSLPIAIALPLVLPPANASNLTSNNEATSRSNPAFNLPSDLLGVKLVAKAENCNVPVIIDNITILTHQAEEEDELCLLCEQECTERNRDGKCVGWKSRCEPITCPIPVEEV